MSSRLWQVLLTAILVLFSQYAAAFGCSGSWPGWGSKTIYFDPVADVPNVGDTKELLDLSTIRCSGNSYDALRIDSFANLNSAFSMFGVELFFEDHYGNEIRSPLYRCIWPHDNGSCNRGNYSNRSIWRRLKIRRVARISGPLNIATGQTLGHMRIQQHGHYGTVQWGSNRTTWSVKNSSAITSPISTCNITTATDQTVALPTVAVTSFSGVNSTTGEKEFSWDLDCQGGAKVYASMQDANNTSNTGTHLVNTSVATGVGVQILKDSSSAPLSFGSANQFHLFDDPNTANYGNGNYVYSVKFKARYVQTATSMTGGVVAAKATITLDYQ